MTTSNNVASNNTVTHQRAQWDDTDPGAATVVEAGTETVIDTGRTVAPGMYGARGWTGTAKIGTIIHPYRTNQVWSDGLDDDECEYDITMVQPFDPFTGLPGSAARQLLDTLTESNLDDRQNLAPTCRELLTIAAERDDVELVGYGVGPARHDERVSIEGFMYYPRNDFADLTPRNAWERIRRDLNITTQHGAPDEVLRFRPHWCPGREGWWVWWD